MESLIQIILIAAIVTAITAAAISYMDYKANKRLLDHLRKELDKEISYGRMGYTTREKALRGLKEQDNETPTQENQEG